MTKRKTIATLITGVALITIIGTIIFAINEKNNVYTIKNAKTQAQMTVKDHPKNNPEFNNLKWQKVSKQK